MKRTLLAVAFATFLPAPVFAHDERKAAHLELQENCIACCLGTRPSLMAKLNLNEDKCASACSSWAAEIMRSLSD